MAQKSLLFLKFEPHVCNEILTMACELEKIAILNVKDVEYRCVL